MRKKVIISIIFLVLLCVFSQILITPAAVHANEAEKSIETSVLQQIKNLDFSNFEDVLSQVGDEYDIFGQGSFEDKILQIVKGTYFNNYTNIFDAVINLIFDGFVKLLPLLLTIIALTVLSSIISNLRSTSSSGVNDIVHFVCYGVAVILLVSAFVQIMNITSNALNAMVRLMEVAFPILLTLLTSVGAVSSVSIYKPIVAVLTGGVSVIFKNFLYPLFVLSFVFVVVGNLTSTVKLTKFSDLISSIFKWVVGFVFTIFTSFLAVQGISAGRFDSVSIKTTKFAVKSYVPLVGSFISDGFDFIILSSVLIKNAIGVGVLLLIFLIVLSPLVQIVIFKLGLQLTSAITEPIGNQKITSFTSMASKVLIYPIAIILVVAFMFLITVALIMATANIF